LQLLCDVRVSAPNYESYKNLVFRDKTKQVFVKNLQNSIAKTPPSASLAPAGVQRYASKHQIAKFWRHVANVEWAISAM
jgi:hypothetical protein